MNSKSLTIAALLAVTLIPFAASAQTASELLQRGIYLQETMGDLDGAIKAYRQVLPLAQNARPSAAQALYRLGVCLAKKNQTAEAAVSFQKVVDEYPEQTGVVEMARALLPSGLKLLPAPWGEGEVLDYDTTVGNTAMGVVRVRYTFRTSKENPANCDFETRMYNAAIMFLGNVEAACETLRPIKVRTSNPMLPGQTIFHGNEASVEVPGKEPRTVKLEGVVFDVNQVPAVLRRLPLAIGYKTVLRVVNSPTAEITSNTVEVRGEEDVKTPAGNFRAFRVEFTNLSTYWISNDASRYPVKWEQSGAMSSVLSAIRRSSQSSDYRDDKAGFSLHLPAGWTAEPAALGADVPGRSMVQLVDSESQAVIILTVQARVRSAPPTIEGMRKEVEGPGSAPAFPPQKMRAGSVQERRVAGNPSLSWLADATGMLDKTPQTAYNVWVRTTALKAEFSALSPPQEFAKLQPRLDAIIDTLTLR